MSDDFDDRFSKQQKTLYATRKVSQHFTTVYRNTASNTNTDLTIQ